MELIYLFILLSKNSKCRLLVYFNMIILVFLQKNMVSVKKQNKKVLNLFLATAVIKQLIKIFKNEMLCTIK